MDFKKSDVAENGIIRNGAAKKEIVKKEIVKNDIVKKDIVKNAIVKLRIEDMSTEGEGIGRAEGFTLFVKDALPGEEIEAKVTKVKKSYGYARLERILQESPYRVEPVCPHHRRCGGCQLQALSYEQQLVFKENKIRNNLIRLGGFAPEEIASCMEPIVGMDNPYRYRNKAQFPVGRDKEGNVVTGFYAARTHVIIPHLDCVLGVEENQTVLEGILEAMKETGTEPYDEIRGTGLIRHVLVRKGFATGELMVCLVINGRKLPGMEVFIEKLCKLKGMTGISLNFNTKKTNVILGDEGINVWGKEYITDYIGDIAYQISPRSFYQVNPIQTKKLYEIALDYAGLTGKETVWDLYCGIGTISLFLAKHAKQVYGVEIVPEAVADARRNAQLNGITNAEFFVGKAEEVVPEFYAQEYRREEAGSDDGRDGILHGNSDFLHPDVIVVDPPRKGCDGELLKTMLRMRPERIVYVSCDSATLARDLKTLCGGGYEVKRVRGVDQFGMSVHVETVCLLSKLHSDQHIEVELQMDELDLTAAESKATYEEIKDYVLEHSGLKVSSLYIAQVKEKCGIIERVNYNLPKSENARQPKCPPEKEAAIREALGYFRMI